MKTTSHQRRRRRQDRKDVAQLLAERERQGPLCAEGKRIRRYVFENFLKAKRAGIKLDRTRDGTLTDQFSFEMKYMMGRMYIGLVESIPTASDDDITELLGNSTIVLGYGERVMMEITAVRKYLIDSGLGAAMVALRENILAITDRRCG